MSSHEVSISELPNIIFTIEEIDFMKLTRSRHVYCKKEGKVYGVQIQDILKTKIFGAIDLSTLSDRELIFALIFATYIKENDNV